MHIRRLLLPALVAGLVGSLAVGLPGGSATTEAATSTIEVTLTGDAENPPVKGDASATARFTFDDVTRKLDYAVTVSGLSADLVTAAHIHRGAAGVNGPVVHTLSAKGFTQVSGSVTLSEADVADLRAGNFYVNVHSKDNPGGFARGQMYLNVAGGTQATVFAAIAAWNRGDARGFLNYWTDAGILEAFDGPREAVLAELPMIMRTTPIAFRSLTNVHVRGVTVTGVLELAFGISLERSLETFVLQGGAWKLAGEQPLSAPIPGGVRAINMEVNEFSFIYDRAQVASATTPIAFASKNTGKQDHEVVLVRINSSAPLLELLMSEGEPEGIAFLGGGGQIKPGESRNVVLLAPLIAGRYALVCFLPDTDGAPHALKGMVSEFNVGGATGAAGGGSGAVRPPNTGDAGLASASNALLLGAVVFALAAAGALTWARRSA